MSLTLRDVFQALDYGTPSGGAHVTFPHVSTDTRTLQPGDLFVALVGKETDGHQFIPQALRAGAGGLVVSQQVVASLDTPVLRVPDTEVAYGLLARRWRDRFDIPVVGVTGSVGKTTLKEMLAAALSPLGPILKTQASQNNETGVPKALLQLTSEHKAAVIEMGMRGSGQIAYLCGIARPTVGVITVIADNHLELLGSQEAIADAKGELLEALPIDGIAVLNGDDPYLSRLRAKTEARVVVYGGGGPTPGASADPSPASGRGASDDALKPSSFSPTPLPLAGEGSALAPGVGASWNAENITSLESGWQFTVRGVPVEIASLSRHDIGNALAALAVADALGVPLAEAAQALKAYTPPPMRMEIVKTNSGVTVLNDAYNAAPASVKSALETLMSYPGVRKIAFLGDMRELGARADEAHGELGGVIAELGGLDALYTVGGLAAQIPSAAQRFADSEEAARFAHESLSLTSGDVILVKGSRAVAMEKIVAALAPPAPNNGGAREEVGHNPTPLLLGGRGGPMRTADPYALGSFLVAFLIALLLGPRVIDALRVLKFGQNINEYLSDGHQKKQGTPSMGGVLLVLSLLLTLGIGLVAAPVLHPVSPALIAVVLVFMAHAGLGFLDDFLKARRGKSLGLLARQKLAGQIVIALGFVVWLFLTAEPNFTTQVWGWRGQHMDFGYVYYVLAFFLIIGLSNAANLTDGLDGLAGGLSIFTLVGLSLTTHINFPQVPLFGFALAGACLGFLWYNAHPAKVFMGDTGSLALGSSFAAMGIIGKQEVLLLLFTVVFLIEMVSVMIQVSVFKGTGGKGPDGKDIGRRVFRMTPIHHHFEKCGWPETQVVARFWILGILALVLGLLLAPLMYVWL